LIQVIDAIDTFSITGIEIGAGRRYIKAISIDLILPPPTVYFLVYASSINE
jgi:hypothetical protein